LFGSVWRSTQSFPQRALGGAHADAQVELDVSQSASGPGHCEFIVHPTHAFVVVLQTGLAPEHCA
jgi:hypothetical protein